MTYTYMELIDDVGQDFYRSEDTNAETLKRWHEEKGWIESGAFDYLQDLTRYVNETRELGVEVTYVEVTEDDVR